MNLVTLSLFAIDILSIGLIFWLVPDAVSRLIRNRLNKSGPRPIRYLIDQLPGLVIGTVFGALVLYFTGVSYENFIVNTGRSISNSTLEVMGLDDHTICQQRAILKHFPATSERQFLREASEFDGMFEPTLEGRESILARAQAIMMTDTSNVMEQAVEKHCNFRIERGLFER
jgi:hypothetical protein